MCEFNVEKIKASINAEYVDKLDKWHGLGSFQKSAHMQKICTLPHKIIGVFAGNQGGKTANAAFSYVMRVVGRHPIPEKNRLAKQIRCLSSSLPESSDADEQDNTQYLELKKMLPAELIIKDITARSKTMVIASPTHGKSYFEFMSTKQELQDTGKVQRCSLWEDEEPPKAFREEAAGGCLRGAGMRL